MEVGQYDTAVSDPSPVTLQLAREPPHPVLPRQVKQRAAPKTRLERIPLLSSRTGPGRAGTETTLTGSHGSKYIGQVLAGRPHGVGQYWAPGDRPGQPLQLAYEGEFVRGVRHGQGTANYAGRGEVYTGQWLDGRRTGPGKLTYADGCVYDGMWSNDVRHGVGTLYSPSGSIFVGTYVRDKRQGLGVTYWGARCRKYVAEYVDDTPTCGSMLELADESIEAPATQQLRDAIAAARVKAAGAAVAGDCALPEMPELGLVQPSRVLLNEFSAVRQVREKQRKQPNHGPAPTAAAIEAGTGTLTANTISLLQHAFILIAGGDDLAAHVLPHQLQELVVLAGLDPAASPVLKLLGLLHRRIEERGGRKLFLDDLLDVAAFFRETPLAVLLQLQSQAVAVEAAAVAAELEDAGQQEAVDRDSLEATQQQQRLLGTDANGSVAEVWREGDVASEDGGPCSGEGSGEGEQWGGGTGEDVFAQHIAMHKPGTAGQVPVECM